MEADTKMVMEVDPPQAPGPENGIDGQVDTKSKTEATEVKVTSTVESSTDKDKEQGPANANGKDEPAQPAPEEEVKSEAESTSSQSQGQTTQQQQEEGRKKRRYTKNLFNDDGLSGSYWKSPAPVVAAAAAAPEGPIASSRPRRSNAGSLMKTALQEIDRKKKGTSPAKTEKTPGAGTGRKSGGAAPAAAAVAVKEEEPTTTLTTSTPPTPTTPGKTPGYRVQPYEKPVTRGRGRPGRPRKMDSDYDEGDEDPEFDPANKKGRTMPKLVQQSPSPSPQKSPIRTYSRKASAGVTPPTLTPSEEKPKTPKMRTYGGRRRSSQKAEPPEEVDDISDSDSGAPSTGPRVSPGTALFAALSIPDELLPTSHEKFLDEFRQKQEKSPTPPERRVHNLDGIVASFKSGSSSRSKGRDTGAPILDSEQNTPAESSSSDGDSESGSSPSDEKENVEGAEGAEAEGEAAGAGGPVSIAKGAVGVASDEAGRIVKWGEDVKPIVVKLGDNQLSIDDQIVTIDYTNYVKEADVEVPFDYDIVFQPEEKLVDPTPLDALSGSGLTSKPCSPKAPEECVLEACKMGCVCESIKRPPPRSEHCGRPKCLLECSCMFNKDHVLIKGDEKNIRSRLRPRVTLLNWKNITKNGGTGEAADERVKGEGGKKHHKKGHHGGKTKRGHRDSEEPAKKKTKTTRGGSKDAHADQKTTPQKGGRGQLQVLQQADYKPGPKSMKLLRGLNVSPLKGPALAAKIKAAANAAALQRRGGGSNAAVNAAGTGQFKVPKSKRPPPLLSTRLASNLPILRRLYSCKPCRVVATRIPKKWEDWKTVESKCASKVPPRRSHPDPNSGNAAHIPFHVATSNFRLTAQADLSYTIVRPNGSVLALLYWEAHTKEAPRSIHPRQRPPPATTTDAQQEMSYPWIYLPLPSSGKVWLFYEIPQYPNDIPAIFLPELGVFLPTDKLMLMTFEANQTGKTSKLYFEAKDESRMTEQGLLNFVYLVPNLPSLIVYGPVPKTQLKTVTRRGMENSLRLFEESEQCKQLRIKLEAAGTVLEEVGGSKYVPEYEDDFVRDEDLIDESIWETRYQEFMIPANGFEDDDQFDGENRDGVEYDYEAGEVVYTDEDEDEEDYEEEEEEDDEPQNVSGGNLGYRAGMDIYKKVGQLNQSHAHAVNTNPEEFEDDDEFEVLEEDIPTPTPTPPPSAEVEPEAESEEGVPVQNENEFAASETKTVPQGPPIRPMPSLSPAPRPQNPEPAAAQFGGAGRMPEVDLDDVDMETMLLEDESEFQEEGDLDLMMDDSGEEFEEYVG